MRPRPAHGITLLALLAPLFACGHTSPPRDRHTEPLAFRVEPLSADEQEAFARQFAPCAVPDADVSDWREWSPAVGVTIRLPQEYTQTMNRRRAAAWQLPDSTVLMIVAHRGNGDATTMIAFIEPPEDIQDDGRCAIQLAGRWAMLSMHRSLQHGLWFHFAAADAGIRDDLGLGAAILTPDERRRVEFMAALSTLRLPDPR
jgi:hypothetical protein